MQAQNVEPGIQAVAPVIGVDATAGTDRYFDTERGPHHKVVAHVTTHLGPAGQMVTCTNTYIVLANGMHYLDPKTRAWMPSQEIVEGYPGGAVARQGEIQMIFANDLATAGAIDVQTPAGRFQSHLLCLSYADTALQTNVLIAEVTNCQGQIIAPNQVLYPNAFSDGVRGSVRYTYRRFGWEQDVIIDDPSSLPAPEEYGLDSRSPTLTLTVTTEFLNPPAPVQKRLLMPGDRLGTVDEDVDWGAVRLEHGQAIVLGAPATTAPIPTSKRWIMTDDKRYLLLEQLSLTAIRDKLVSGVKGASIDPRAKAVHRMATLSDLPRRGRTKGDPHAMEFASSTPPERGFLIDYSTVSSAATNYVFQSDSTYFIAGLVSFSGVTICEGNSVLKFTNSPDAKISAGTIVCATSPYRMAILTSMHDNTVGETVANSTGSPTNYNAGTYLQTSMTGGLLKYLRFSYAGTGLQQTSAGNPVWHSQFVQCSNAIVISLGGGSASQELHNVLLSKCCYAVNNPSYAAAITVSGEHVTADQISGLLLYGPAGSSVSLTNSVLTAVSGIRPHGGGGTLAYSVQTTNGSGVYQTVGGASYYLVDDSANRGAGTTSINAGLLSDLAHKTTFPPLLVTNNFTNDTVIYPRLIRDNDTPDLGFHYDCLDYVVSGKSVSAKLVLTNGVALGIYGKAPTAGLTLSGQGRVVSEGLPTALNYIARYNTVQEQSTTNWSGANVGLSINSTSSSTCGQFRFTGWSVPGTVGTPGTYGTHFYGASDGASNSCFCHCQFTGGNLFTYGLATLTNCLLERVYVKFDDDHADGAWWYLYNNLFKGGTLWYRISSGDLSYGFGYDNLFDKTSINKQSGNAFTAAFNAYVTNYSRLSTSANDVILTNSPTYQSGVLGSFYYPINDGMLSKLIDAGSRWATNAALCHYTTTTNQNREAGSKVDIGFHYVAIDATIGLAFDTDADGLPDCFEDTNGNGVYDTGDLADLTNTDTDGDGLPDGWEWNHFGNFAQGASDDFDGDGLTNIEEYSCGSDPNSVQFDVQFDKLVRSASVATGLVSVIHGVPNKMAVLLDSTNFAAASWVSYNPSFSVNLGTVPGTHLVWVGLKGRADTSLANWSGDYLTLDTEAPVIVITNPASTTLSQPMIQLKGYSIEPLISLRYDVTNAVGSVTNEAGHVTTQWFDTNLFELTTNWFQCLDIGLSVGTNVVTLRATDRAGNTSTNSYTYVLSFAGDTNPPVVQLYWPLNNDQLCGTDFMVQGFLDDPTAKVVAQITNNNDGMNVGIGIVERDGLFWVEDLPLPDGTNTLMLTVTDAAGNVTTTNINIIKSSVVLTIDDFAGQDLNQPTIDVTGTINVNDHTVWVNGVKATLNGDGTWTASNVPVNEGGTAVVEAAAIPNTDNGGNGSGGSGGTSSTIADPGNPISQGKKKQKRHADKDAVILMTHYEKKWIFTQVELDLPNETVGKTSRIDWTVNRPGYQFWDSCWGDPIIDDYYYEWSDKRWDAQGHATTYGSTPRRGRRGDVCGVKTYSSPTTSILSPPWPGETCNKGALRFLSDGFHTRIQLLHQKEVVTTYKLYTGSKAVPGRKSLFVLSASAKSIPNRFYPEVDDNDDGYQIPSTEIRLGDFGQLESDGLLYAALADDKAPHDVSLFVNRPYYRNDAPSVAKSKLMSQCYASTPKDKARTTIGVGEEVDIGFDIEFSGSQPTWTTKGGGLSSTTGWGTKFTAPSNAATPTVTATIRGAECPITFDVREPSDITSTVRLKDYFQTFGIVGAGMEMNVFMQPTTVSFYRLEMIEPEEATTGISGYFSDPNHPPPVHNTLAGANAPHPVAENNQIAGPPIGDHFDHAYDGWGWPIGVHGSYTWPIHAIWRVRGTAATNPLSGWTDQVFTLSDDGTMRIDKLHHFITRGVNEHYGVAQ